MGCAQAKPENQNKHNNMQYFNGEYKVKTTIQSDKYLINSQDFKFRSSQKGIQSDNVLMKKIDPNSPLKRKSQNQLINGLQKKADEMQDSGSKNKKIFEEFQEHQRERQKSIQKVRLQNVPQIPLKPKNRGIRSKNFSQSKLSNLGLVNKQRSKTANLFKKYGQNNTSMDDNKDQPTNNLLEQLNLKSPILKETMTPENINNSMNQFPKINVDQYQSNLYTGSSISGNVSAVQNNINSKNNLNNIKRKISNQISNASNEFDLMENLSVPNQNDETKDRTTSVQDDDQTQYTKKVRKQIHDSNMSNPSRAYFSLEINKSPPLIFKNTNNSNTNNNNFNFNLIENNNNTNSNNNNNLTKFSSQFTNNSRRSSLNQQASVNQKLKLPKKKELALSEIMQQQQLQLQLQLQGRDQNSSYTLNNKNNQLNSNYNRKQHDRQGTLELRCSQIVDDFGYVKRKNSQSQNPSQQSNNIGGISNLGSRHRLNSSNFNNVSSIHSPYIQNSAFSEQINF